MTAQPMVGQPVMVMKGGPRCQTPEEKASECCTSCLARWFCAPWNILCHDGPGKDFWICLVLYIFVPYIGALVYSLLVWVPQDGVAWNKGGMTKEEFNAQRAMAGPAVLPVYGAVAAAPTPMQQPVYHQQFQQGNAAYPQPGGPPPTQINVQIQ